MAGYYDRDRTTAAGTMRWPEPHLGATSEFLVAGWPYSLSFDNSSGGSVTKTVAFEYVTQFITVTAVSGDATISLQGGADFIIPSGTTQKFEVKATTIAITSANGTGFRLVAGLTNVRKKHYPATLPTQATVA